jgi:tetratricopeptide (TPR) repeat protein
MSPEQAMGKAVNTKTDIWSLGVVLYEMLTIKQPFKGEYEQAITYSIINESPDWNELNNQNVTDELINIIKRMLDKEVENRFDSNELITLFKKTHLWSSTTDKSRSLKIFSRYINLSYFYKNKWKLALFIFPLIAIFLLLQLISNKTISLKPTDFVVVANFENRTNEKYFDHSLNEALKVSLRQSSFVTPLTNSKIQSALTYMKLSPDYSLDKNTAISIAKREGAAFVILGNISKLGNKYILTSEIVDPHSSETIIIERKEVENVEAVLKGMDDLVVQIRENLGEAVADISKLNTPLAQVTTPSIEALDLYSRGNKLETQGKYHEAIELKEQAILIDSLFVMAISDLSYDYQKIGDYEKALYYHNKILPLIDRVSQRERYIILVNYYGPSFEMDYEKAFQIAQNWITLYSNDAIAYATLGHMAMFTGQFELALSANERAIKLDSSLVSTCLNNSGFALALMGDHKEALKYFKKSKEYRPDYASIDIYMAQVYWMQGQLDTAETLLLNKIDSSDKLSELKIRSHLAALYHSQGKLTMALDQCSKAIQMCRKYSYFGEEAYFHYLYGSIESERGSLSNSVAALNEANRLCVSPYFEYFLTAVTFSEIGELKNTSQLIKRIKSLDSKNLFFINRRDAFINYLNGVSWFAQNNFDKAVH